MFLPLSQDGTQYLKVPKQVVNYIPELVKMPFPFTYLGHTIPATYQTKRMINAYFNYPPLGLYDAPVGHQQTTDLSTVVTGWGHIITTGLQRPYKCFTSYY